MQSRINREKAQRIARLLDLVDVPGVESHWNWIGLVDGGVPEFSVDQNRNRDQGSLAIGSKLKNSHSTWPNVFFSLVLPFSRDDLRTFFLTVAGRYEAEEDRKAKKSEV